MCAAPTKGRSFNDFIHVPLPTREENQEHSSAPMDPRRPEADSCKSQGKTWSTSKQMGQSSSVKECAAQGSDDLHICGKKSLSYHGPDLLFENETQKRKNREEEKSNQKNGSEHQFESYSRKRKALVSASCKDKIEYRGNLVDSRLNPRSGVKKDVHNKAQRVLDLKVSQGQPNLSLGNNYSTAVVQKSARSPSKSIFDKANGEDGDGTPLDSNIAEFVPESSSPPAPRDFGFLNEDFEKSWQSEPKDGVFTDEYGENDAGYFDEYGDEILDTESADQGREETEATVNNELVEIPIAKEAVSEMEMDVAQAVQRGNKKQKATICKKANGKQSDFSTDDSSRGAGANQPPKSK